MKKNKTFFPALALSFLALFGSYSCQNPDENIAKLLGIGDLIVNSDFKFNTQEDLSINIQTLDNNNGPVSEVLLKIYTDYPESGGNLILSGVTDAAGQFSTNYQISAGTDSLVVATDAIGFVNQQKVAVINSSLTISLGGKQSTSLRSASANDVFKSSTFVQASTVYKTLGQYDGNGVPKNLVSPNDLIDAQLLSDINATVPERIALTTSHPQYFNSSNESNLVVTELCNVWVTFIHEGAGYRNVFGYYKYKTSNPPATVAAIDTVFIVFPNVSFSGSGGGLSSGNKMYLGQFPAGTEIGWVLIADGWNGSAVTTNYRQMYYSDQNFNNETNPDKKQHTILLNDINRSKFMLGFEDLNRSTGASDNDFNDAIFFVSADPVKAIQSANLPVTTPVKVDTDKDGIADNEDAYPSDATKAFNSFYPSESTFGSLAFEDLWPSKGDYDFNDMVVDYNYKLVTNASNKVVQVVTKVKLKAIGASYHSGFGIQLPLTPNQIASVSGYNLQDNQITLNSNGTEAGQTKATIIAFNDGYNILPWAAGSSTGGVNTTPIDPYVTPQVLTLTINLTSPVAMSLLGTPPYNPFIIINGDRTKEVHLIDHEPTSLANTSMLGTFGDDSNPSTGRYYVTSHNLPFAIDISQSFDYPIEKAEITKAFLKFYSWGESGGKSFKDWYLPLSGYRDNKYIFSK